MKKIVFYVPVDAAIAVKESVFDAGAGKIGNYDKCCFETVGTGQFRPLEGSNPTIGNQNEVEQVEELRIETICSDDKLSKVIESLRMSHPYEEPAIDVFELVSF